MKLFDSIPIDKNPIKLGSFEALLLFHEYPTTIVYEDEKGHPIIKEWVDCSPEEKIDRFFYYRVSKFDLKRFLDSEISHLDLINSSRRFGPLLFEDFDSKNKIRTYSLASVEQLPAEYKPSYDFYLSQEDAVDFDSIFEHFNLLFAIPKQPSYLDKVKSIADSSNSETIFFRLQQGKGVGNGTANTEILAKSLLKFDRLYKEMSLDDKLGKQRGDIQLNIQKNKPLLKMASTEVYQSVAASYGLLIRPTYSQTDIYGTSNSEKVALKFFELISKSQEAEILKTEYTNHSDFTLKSFKAFVDEIKNLELKLEFNWVSPGKEFIYFEELDFKKATLISSNLDELTVEDKDSFSVTGRFRAINCDTGSFVFISTNNEKFTGTFDKLIREGSEQINFLITYEISISRVIKKEPGKKNSTIIDVIIAFYKADN